MNDTVDFDTYHGVRCADILVILEGYASTADSKPVLLVVLKNGAVLILDVNDYNLSALSAWRSWKQRMSYSG